MIARTLVLKIMRVPHDPEPPPGSPPRVFRAAENYFWLKVVQWVIAHVLTFIAVGIALVGLEAAIASGKPPGFAIIIFRVLQVAIASFIAIEFLLSLAVLRLDFELRWYMLSDRAIRIREGIISLREKTMALANVQNISIKQGPLQRLLGIADVEVTTAGGGGGPANAKGQQGHVGEPMHIAYFRGVDNAEQIRDLVREGVRRQKDAGLGDPDDHHAVDPVNAGTAVEAAREVLREARALRKEFTGFDSQFPGS